jgi:hypothetical protein
MHGGDPNTQQLRRSERRRTPYAKLTDIKPRRKRASPRPPEYHAAYAILETTAPRDLVPPVLSIIAAFYMEVPDRSSPFRGLSRRDAQELGRSNRFSVLPEATAVDAPVPFPTYCHVPKFDREHGSTYQLMTPVRVEQRAGSWWVQFRRVDQSNCSTLVMLVRLKVPMVAADGGSLLNYIDVPRFRIRRQCAWVPPRLGRVVTCESHSYAGPLALNLNLTCGVEWCQANATELYLMAKYNARDVYMNSDIRDTYSINSVTDVCSDRAGGHAHDTAASHLLAKQSAPGWLRYSFQHRWMDTTAYIPFGPL